MYTKESRSCSASGAKVLNYTKVIQVYYLSAADKIQNILIDGLRTVDYS
jgi:hypothetical protein